MNKYIKFGLVLPLLLISIIGSSLNTNPAKRKKDTNQGNKVMGCGPATTTRNMVFNNVRSLIETGGSLWQDRANGNAGYVVPRNQSVAVIYAGALWMGGKSPDQQLKLAAVKFRATGDDFWPGPLTTSENSDVPGEVTAETCSKYDKMFVSYKIDAQQHDAWARDLLDDDVVYTTPAYFEEYPAHGNVANGESYHLAPFYDFDGDDFYDPTSGDYPWYDVLDAYECREASRLDEVPLFGDETYYWIFNDKGNIHSETQGDPIGMEIRAQAFSFATTDEINNMTFYNYTLINQGTQTLTQTYFGQYADADIGASENDFVGCDVGRGLGYCYNGTAVDETAGGVIGWGENPPAIGIDFFEGPYQDADGIDNPSQPDITIALDSAGIPYKGLGVGYGDGKIDNERFGMRKFIYYNREGAPGLLDPDVAPEYYNYMTGFWKDGAPLTFGGNGHDNNSGVPCDYMFPGDSDPLKWGTHGADGGTENWSEFGEDNTVGDRRFIQSAGPFTLEPGQWNNITVGVVYGRAFSGDSFESVKQVLAADDKAQALFDACFEAIPGPSAPDLTVHELENKLVLTLNNDNFLSNNTNETEYNDELIGFNPGINPEFNGETLSDIERSYQFQGYIIYQLADETVSAADIRGEDADDKARIIFQCDKKDGISRIFNYTYDIDQELIDVEMMVDGADEGIQHSFEVTTDAFALGSPLLVNFKSYYFMAIAYAYNNYGEYEYGTLTSDPSGQDVQYLGSEKSSTGGEIRAVVGIPHRSDAGLGISSLDYGDGVEITQIEGYGNGLNVIDITKATENKILEDNYVEELTFKKGSGPVDIKVVDPVRVQDVDFELKLVPYLGDDTYEDDSTFWVLTDLTNDIEINIFKQAFKNDNEYILADYGLSLTFSRYEFFDPTLNNNVNKRSTELLFSSISVPNPSSAWYAGVPDEEGFNELNWIRSGTQEVTGNAALEIEVYYDDLKSGGVSYDSIQSYEKIIGGTWAPMYLTSRTDEDLAAESPVGEVQAFVGPREAGSFWNDPAGSSEMVYTIGLNNVDVVFTNDKSKWTRSPVLEMQVLSELAEGEAEKMFLRESPSVDKNGLSAGDAGYNSNEGDMTGPRGMGWFPGYAIDIGTGERLNIAFGEDSWMEEDNGNDMLWNPSENLRNNLGEARAGGQHWIYIFKNGEHEQASDDFCPRYDRGQFIYDAYNDEDNIGSAGFFAKLIGSCTWVGSGLIAPNQPLLSVEEGLIPQETRIKLRVAKKYKKYSSTQVNHENANGSQNDWNPLYSFSTKSASTINAGLEESINDEILDEIQVVPNPYYAYSQYETGKLDNRIKLTNLPTECTITIYNVSGTLIRQFKKADPLSYLDWDLKNARNVPISSGVYIIHVEVPEVGETVLKWFGVMRPVDLDNL